MKIWPFDIAAERSGGLDITPDELRLALEPFAKIRKAVGDKMQIMVEFHSLWSLPMAKRLAQRLAEYDTYWHEDPFRLDHVRDLKEYAASRLDLRLRNPRVHAFREYLETGFTDVVMLDLSWWWLDRSAQDCRRGRGQAVRSRHALHPTGCLHGVDATSRCTRVTHPGRRASLLFGLVQGTGLELP